MDQESTRTSSSSTATTASLTTTKSLPFQSVVQDLAMLGDGTTVAVALRGTNYLRLVSSTDCAELTRVNMNAAGDDHVSFSATALALSPAGQYLAVVTDKARVLVLRTQDWSQLCR